MLLEKKNQNMFIRWNNRSFPVSLRKNGNLERGAIIQSNVYADAKKRIDENPSPPFTLTTNATKQYSKSILKTGYYNAAFVYRRRIKGKRKRSMDVVYSDCVLTFANVTIAGVRCWVSK